MPGGADSSLEGLLIRDLRTVSHPAQKWFGTISLHFVFPDPFSDGWFVYPDNVSLRVTVSSAKARKGLSCHLKACAILMLLKFNADVKNSPGTIEHPKDF